MNFQFSRGNLAHTRKNTAPKGGAEIKAKPSDGFGKKKPANFPTLAPDIILQ